MFKLLRFLKGYRVFTVLGSFFKLLEAVGELIVPLVVARMIDRGIADGNTAYIWKMSGLLILLGAVGLGFSVTAQFMASKAGIGFGTKLRGALYRHIGKLSLAETDKFGTAGLLTRINSDSIQAQVGVAMFIRLALRAPFIVAGALVMAIVISPRIGLGFILMAAVESVILWLVMTRTAPHYRKIQSNLDEVSQLTRTNLSGARVVRAFSRQKEEEARFYESADRLKKRSVRAALISALLSPITYAIINLAVIAVLHFGGKAVYAGTLSQGDVIALVNYLSQILLALVATADLVVIFTKSSACAGRINEVFAVQPSITDGSDTPPTPVAGADTLTFEDVHFGYHETGAEAIKGVSFSLGRGQTLGVIGSTGSGKSTLTSLVLRFYDVKSGAVLLDGVNIKEYPLGALRKKIGIVPQAPMLFSGTLRENLTFGKEDATDEEMIEALKAAQAWEFVQALPDGLNTRVSRGGRNFSGGQRQRLTIARALVGTPELLILDDASSALDYATDAQLRGALKRLPFAPTVILISQRAFSLKHADAILVLENGEQVGYGTHEALLENCEVYREICNSQTKEEEA